MQFLADHDPLTRLLNRRSFVRHLALETSRAQRYERPFTLLVGDLNGFKKLNDELGHQAGDQALEALGRVLMEGRREVDGVYRIGGDEFALILPGATGEVAAALGERLATAARELDLPVPVTLSIGAAQLSGEIDTGLRLLQAADLALYDVKSAGRDAVALHREPPGRAPAAEAAPAVHRP
jgi:diguanylate cyclase (GGDEF)-like protein